MYAIGILISDLVSYGPRILYCKVVSALSSAHPMEPGDSALPDRKGAQDKYAKNVAAWCDVYDLIPNSSYTKLEKNLSGSILQSQFFWAGKIFYQSVPQDTLNSDEGAQHVVRLFTSVIIYQ